MEKSLRNTEYLLNKPLPVDIRLSVYKETLSILKDLKNKSIIEKYGLSVYGGLCLFLPCVLWNLHSYLSIAPNGKEWCFVDTPVAFPELSNDRIGELLILSNSNDQLELRIEFLEQFINQLENIVIKPPLGIIPKNIWLTETYISRFNELKRAIKEYKEAGLIIDYKWTDEYFELAELLINEK